MKGKINLKESGFTLVELIIAIALLAILTTFIIAISTQMITLTAKIQSKDVALALAQAKIEELRSNLTIPEFLQDEPKPGYIRTVTSTYILENGNIVRFLRHVTVAVKTPTVLGARLVQLETDIQTYRPQVYFTFPEIGESFLRHYVSSNPPANLFTYLEGEIRDDAFDIVKSNVQYRTRSGDGTSWSSWSNWASLSGSSAGEIYTDPGPFYTKTATSTLLTGHTYYFQFKINGSSNDGSMQEIQIQATNTNSINNLQPTTPQGGTSYIRLITDNTSPQISSVEGLPQTNTVTTGTDLSIRASASDPTNGGVASGVYVLYFTICKTPSTGTPTFYWKLNEIGTLTWTSTGGPYYFPMSYDANLEKWTTSPLYTTSIFAQSGQSTIYQIKICAIDKVKGKRSNYQSLIPVQGAQFGLTMQDPSDSASGILPYAWVDTNTNTGAVNANFTSTTYILSYPKPTVETSTATSLTPTAATLYGNANSYSLTSTVWFDYGLDKNYGYSTPYTPFSSTSTLPFSANISGLTPNTTYFYRAVIQNDWGIFYGQEKDFTTPNQPTQPTPYIETVDASGISSTTATLNGKANSYGLPSYVWFEYNKQGEASFSRSTVHISFSSSSVVDFFIMVSDLDPNTIYSYRAVIQNDGRIFYGEDKTFQTTTP